MAPGDTFLGGLLSLSILQFVTEFWHNPADRLVYGNGVSVSQAAAVAVGLAAMTALAFRRQRQVSYG